jgi:hypothetical protein
MIDFLSRRSTQRMIGYGLRENEAMRELARSHGFAVSAAASDADAPCFVLTLQGRSDAMECAATPASPAMRRGTTRLFRATLAMALAKDAPGLSTTNFVDVGDSVDMLNTSGSAATQEARPRRANGEWRGA